MKEGHNKQVVFIHGAEAFSDYDTFLEYLRTVPVDDPLSERPQRWKDSLQKDLGNGYEVFTPSMPNKQNAKYEEWKIWFERHIPFLRDGVILVGHSQGGYFLAKYLCENVFPREISALLLMATPFGPDDFGLPVRDRLAASGAARAGTQTGEEDGGDFKFDSARLPELAKQVEHVAILHSTDDPVVPFVHAKRYKEALPSVELVSFEDKGHFLGETFPEFIAYIKKL